MAFEYLSNAELGRAVAEYRASLVAAGMRSRAETVPVPLALGRVTAAPVYARISAPHYHACAMDGIALSASSTFGASSTAPVVVEPSDYAVVDTGDPLPERFDAVVMIEDVLPADGDDRPLGEGAVKLHVAVSPWANIRQIGEDICAGEMLLTSNVVIEPAAQGAMLAAGVMEVDVMARPVIGIIPTGDEIVPPSDHPGAGDVMEFNSTIFSGMLAQWGAVGKTYPIVKDDPDLIRAALQEAVGECDGVLLIAGSSAGRDDYARQTIGAVGEVLYHGLAIKPGKPAVLGRVGAKPVIGMPGYPVSGIVVANQVLHPLIEALAGRVQPPEPVVSAKLSRRVVSSLKYREFLRVRVGKVGDGYIASPLARGAGVVTSFVKADGIVDIPQNSEGVEAGEEVAVALLRPEEDLANTLVVIGSHDPLIDEIAEMLHGENPEFSVASTHVGSMGAITAAKRGENHCGGVHLLDEESGTYNVPYLRKYFPQGGVRLIECVYRQQGLMVAPGNPKGIATMADLLKPGMKYVNRQKGSGTRVLCDYVCKKEGVDTDALYGYDHEEFTHTAVAALVEAGSADAGMGIYSAAKMYGLDFIPLTEEQYDFLVPDSAWESPLVQALLKMLGSDRFRVRIESMGGYRLDRPGRVRIHL